MTNLRFNSASLERIVIRADLIRGTGGLVVRISVSQAIVRERIRRNFFVLMVKALFASAPQIGTSAKRYLNHS